MFLLPVKLLTVADKTSHDSQNTLICAYLHTLHIRNFNIYSLRSYNSAIFSVSTLPFSFFHWQSFTIFYVNGGAGRLYKKIMHKSII